MNYQGYKEEDFAQDSFFCHWVRHPDEETNLFWQHWLEENPSQKPVVRKARGMVLALNIRENELDARKIQRIWHGVERNMDDHSKAIRLPERGTITARWMKIAAVLIGFVIIAGLAYVLNIDRQEDTEIIAIRYIEKSTSKGQKSSFKLPDGSKVKLNANSKLRFPEVFSENERRINLIGEAFFEVTKDSLRPFVITSGDIRTTVLGTSFNVRAYPKEEKIKVAVESGKVAVEDGKLDVVKASRNTTVLLPKEMAVYSKGQGTIKKKNFLEMAQFGWKNGIIYFKNADIHEILEILENWYGVSFVVEERLNEAKDYTAIYHNKSLETVLYGLSFVFDFEYTIDNKVVTLK
ncbi:FecR domain-containing protein [Fulvivirgaceae bacterium BMA10]|uniref:FecR domain-containing protein n=1 Tax=Splendidivirga corallicola TaxID=3051826 RepID=A0ABT8KIC5_9BACT|nr:FecR domain-containing protein [Fulvivirgaceae bacterium BMA10]